MFVLKHRGETIARHSTKEACIVEAITRGLVGRLGIESSRPGHVVMLGGATIERGEEA